MKRLMMLIPLVPPMVIGLIGLIYLLMPHSFHIKYMIDFGLSHMAHMTIGIIMILFAVVMIASILGISLLGLFKKGGRR